MKHNVHKKERGSALLMTLGILALAMVMAMSFAFSARTTRQVAKVNADQVKARIFAESALNRVLVLLKEGYAGGTYYLPTYEKDEDDRKNMHNKSLDNLLSVLSDAKYLYTFNNANSQSSNDFGQNYMVSLGQNDDGEDNTAKTKLLDNISQVVPSLQHEEVCNKNLGFQDIKSNGTDIDGRIAWIVVEEANKIDINRAIPLEEQKTGSDIYNCPYIYKVDDVSFASRLYNEEENKENFAPDKSFYYNLLGFDYCTSW